MYTEINSIFERHIKNALIYEGTFKNIIKTIEPSIEDKKLNDFPKNLFAYAKDLVKRYDFEKGRNTYISTGKLFGNSFLTKYMDKAVEDFKNNPRESVDLLEPAQQNSFYGQVYEGFIAGITSKPEILNQLLGLDKQGKIGMIGKGVGTERHPGDIQMALKDFNLDKALDLGSYIEVKYSDDYMQVINKAHLQSTEKFATTDQVWEQIYEEIEKGLQSSIAANFSTGWMDEDTSKALDLSLFLQTSRNGMSDRNILLEYAKIQEYVSTSTPKALIYIMKSKGLWLSQLLKEVQPIVEKNAAYIIKNKIYGINKKRLWYNAK